MTEVSSLATHLREATQAAHRRLDHHPLLTELLSPTLTREVYGQSLAALYGAHGAVESVLADFAPAALLPPRLPGLAADLAALGVVPRPLTVAVPQPGNAAEQLGMLYVIEGSNLGGLVIARQLARHLPASAPRSFFGGSEGLPRWQRFWTFAQSCIRPEHFDRAAMAATVTFEFYRKHLDSCLGPA